MKPIEKAKALKWKSHLIYRKILHNIKMGTLMSELDMCMDEPQNPSHHQGQH